MSSPMRGILRILPSQMGAPQTVVESARSHKCNFAVKPTLVSHLQCTMVGATVALFSLKSRTLSTNWTNSTVSEGVPWSGQDRYCICK